MPAASFDIIVIGCGGFGSAAMSHLARRGIRVLGIDQFHPPHDRGSSHGETRVIRKAYFEHPDYVPLLHRAYEQWDELTERTAHHRSAENRELFVRCGLLLAGPADGEVIAGARQAAERHLLDLQSLTHQDCRERFSMFRIPETSDIVFEQDAGYLWVERCVAAHLADAADHGATFCFDQQVTGISWQDNSVMVQMQNGDRHHAAKVIVTAGAWMSRVMPDYARWIQVRRKTLFWFPTQDERWSDPERSTIHLFDVPPEAIDQQNLWCQFYGFPCVDGQTVKLAEHSGGQDYPNEGQVNRVVTNAEAGRITDYIKACLFGIHPQPIRSCVCYYSMSPDGHFLIDHLTDAPVVVAGGFSGHGFKFTSIIGQALADLAQSGQTDLPIDFLSVRRFEAKQAQ